METGFSLGSNLGDRLAHLSEARRRILTLPGVRCVAQSPVYETEPVGVKPEYRHLKFLNAVLVVESEQAPAWWLTALRRLEEDMGRNRTEDRYAPRPVDVDILYVGQERIRDPGRLEIPHPRWTIRRFVVQPLADVRPDLVLPGETLTVRERLSRLPDTEKIEKFAEAW
jgi:2-amino-4-hydroxy-6-hydroxymethyldihydropteridine diphosphokinase